MRRLSKIPILRPVKKYAYLCVIYMAVSFGLTEILIFGSNLLADATDRLFAGESIQVGSLLPPFVLLMLLGGIAAWMKSFFKNTFSIRMQTDIRKMIVSKLVNLKYAYFDEQGTGALLNRMITDISQIEMLFAETLPELAVGVITITAISIYIGTQSIRLLLVTLICYPLLLWLAGKTTVGVGKISKVRLELYDELENTALDALQGITVGRSFNLYETQKERIFKIVDDIVKNEAVRHKIGALNQIMGRLVSWIPKIICYLFCLYEIQRGQVGIGTMFAYVILLDRIAVPLGNIPDYMMSMREYKISVHRLQDVMEQDEEPCGDMDYGTEGETVIMLEHIGFGYTDTDEVLSDINIEIKKGTHAAFVGDSGGGKSTAMKILCGFYYPQQGNYKIYGHDFRKWDLDALRAKIALVSQNVFLFPATIAENVSYGKAGASMEEIMDACRKADIHDFIMQLGAGYDTMIGERGARLSGGQKQRLSIARAFLKDAPILLLDEPTSAVDVETEKEIQKALKEISKGRTVITVTHRLSTIIDADEIYVFEHGRIAEKGTHGQLLQNGGVYASLYGKERLQYGV